MESTQLWYRVKITVRGQQGVILGSDASNATEVANLVKQMTGIEHG